jgi:hypothetical protein
LLQGFETGSPAVYDVPPPGANTVEHAAALSFNRRSTSGAAHVVEYGIEPG